MDTAPLLMTGSRLATGDSHQLPFDSTWRPFAHAAASGVGQGGHATVPRPPSIRAGSRPITSSCMRPLAPVTPAMSTPHLRNRSGVLDPTGLRACSTAENV